MDLKSCIGRKVKLARQSKRLTQAQLADSLDKAVETISNIERGHALPGLDTLQRIGEVLDVPIVYFFEGLEDRRIVSKARRQSEDRLASVVPKLTDVDLSLAVALVETIVRERAH